MKKLKSLLLTVLTLSLALIGACPKASYIGISLPNGSVSGPDQIQQCEVEDDDFPWGF